MDHLQLKLCDIQGRLFELSKGLDSEAFVKMFMNSKVAERLDSSYNKLQWMGEEYLLEELLDEQNIGTGAEYGMEIMYWIGYIYRYWHLLTGESSKKIYRQAPVKTMRRNYMMFHTLDPEIAIEDLKEIYRRRKSA
ncbi:MAG: hypothetical protein HUJ69_02770 [Lachnospiraceae bacterium]|nr:hypothetical protein [Lachnospiraceae bacterium]